MLRTTWVSLALFFTASLPAASLGSPVTTWTGAAGTGWDDPGNWTSGVPTGEVDVVIPPTSNDPSTAGAVGAECAMLTIEPGASLTVTPTNRLIVLAGASFGGPVLGDGLIRLDGPGQLDSPAPAPLVEPLVAIAADVEVAGALVRLGRLRLELGELSVPAPNVLRVTNQARFEGGTVTGDGTIDLNGDAFFVGTSVVDPPVLEAAGNLAIDSNFAPASGRVSLDGSGPRTISLAGVATAANFFRLWVEQQAVVITAVPIVTGEDLRVFGLCDTSADLTVAGAMQVDGQLVSAGDLDLEGPLAGSGAIDFQGEGADVRLGAGLDLTGSLDAANGIVFDGDGQDTVATGAATVLPDTEIAIGGTLTAISPTLVIDSDLVLSSGELILGAGTVLTVLGATTFQGGLLGGEGELELGQGDLTVDTQETVTFAGVDLTIDGDLNLSDGQLEIIDGSTTRVEGNANFSGGILLGDGGRLEVVGEGAGNVRFTGSTSSVPPEIALTGDWTADENFAPQQGLVIFEGGAQRILGVGAEGPAPLAFHGVEVRPDSSVSTTEDLALGADLDVQSDGGSGGSFDTDGDLVVQGDLNVDGSFFSGTGNVDVDGDVTGDGDVEFASVTGNTTFGGSVDFGGSMSSAGMLSFDGLGEHFIQTGSSTVLPPIDLEGEGTVVMQGGLVEVGPPTTPGEGTLPVYLRHQSGRVEVAEGTTLRVLGSVLFAAEGGELAGAGTVDVEGDVSFESTTAVSPPDVQVAGDWTASASFAPTSGRVRFDGDVQTIASFGAEGPQPLTFHRVEVAPSSSVSTSEDLSLGEDLDVEGNGGDGGSFDTDGDLAVQGDLHVDGSFFSGTGNVDVDGDVTGDGDVEFASVTGNTTFGGSVSFGGSMSSAGMLSFDGLGKHFVQVGSSTVLPPIDLVGEGTVTFTGGLVQVGPSTTAPEGTDDLVLRHFSSDLEVTAATTLLVHGSARFGAENAEVRGVAGSAIDVYGDVVFAGTSATTPPDFFARGDWTADAAFAPTQNRVRFVGDTHALVSGDGSTLSFHRMEIEDTSAVSTTDAVATGDALQIGGSFDTESDLAVGGHLHVQGLLTSTTGNLDVDGDVTGGGDINLASVSGNTNFGGSVDFGGSISSAGMLSFDGLGEHFVQVANPMPPLDFEGPGKMTVKGLLEVVPPGNEGGEGEPVVLVRHLGGTLEIEAGAQLDVKGSVRFEAGGGELLGATGLGALAVSGDVVFAGTVSTDPPDMDVVGRWTADDGFQPESGTVVLRGEDSTISSTAASGELFFHTLFLSEGVRTPTADVVIRTSTVFVSSGGSEPDAELNTGPFTVSVPSGVLEVEGRLTVASGGRLALGADATGVILTNGTLTTVGNYPEVATVTGYEGGGYTFVLNGTIEASNYVFEDMGSGGITLNESAVVAAAPHDLRGGVFRRPSAELGSRLLRIARTTPTNLRYVSFEDPLGVGTFNVSVPATSAEVSFTNFSGNFAGEDFDDDPSPDDDLIVWTAPDETEVVFFSASPGPELVTLDWATTKEVDTTAFVLERSNVEPGSPALVLTELLPAGPASYQFADTNAIPLVLQDYRLFARLSHGPLLLLGSDAAMAYVAELPANVEVVNPEVQGLLAIELAVQAVTEPNSMLLVQPGTYRPFRITADTPPGLKIVADPNGEVLIDTTLEPVRIAGLPAGESVEISGFTVGTGFAPELDATAEGAMTSPGILVEGCAGTVVLDRMSIVPAPGQTGVEVVGSTAVVQQESDVFGTPGLRLSEESVAAWVNGALSSLEVLGSSQVTAGGTTPGSVFVEDGSEAELLGGVQPSLRLPDLVSLNAPLTLELLAGADAPWISLFSPGLSFVDLMSPGFELFLLADPTMLLFLPVGTTDATGQGALTLDLPADPNLLGVRLVFQALSMETASSPFRFSNVRSAVPLQ